MNNFRSALSGASRIEKLELLSNAAALVQRGDELNAAVVEVLKDEQFRRVLDRLLADRQEQRDKLVKRASANRPVVDNVYAMVKEASISRGETGFGTAAVDTALKDKINAMLQSTGSITLAMITGGIKIGNELKVGQLVDPELADWVTISHLQALADALETVTQNPAKIVLVADGHLHSGDAGLDARQADLYVNLLASDAQRYLGARNVAVASPRNQLDDRWYQYLLDEIRRIRLLAASDSAFRQLLDEQAEALVSSINLRPRGWTYGHTVEVFAALAGHPASSRAHADASELQKLAGYVTIGYTANNHAVRDLKLVERVVQEIAGEALFIRTSVHAKPHEPRLALAPSSRFSRHYLLPMHSTGRLEVTEKGDVGYGPLFDIEGRFHQMHLIGFFDGQLQRNRALYYTQGAYLG